MDMPRVPFPLIVWLKDFFLAPKRIAALAELKAAEADPRPKCPGCGIGRVILTDEHERGPTWRTFKGICEGCQREWQMTAVPLQVTGTLRKPLQLEHAPSPYPKVGNDDPLLERS